MRRPRFRSLVVQGLRQSALLSLPLHLLLADVPVRESRPAVELQASATVVAVLVVCAGADVSFVVSGCVTAADRVAGSTLRTAIAASAERSAGAGSDSSEAKSNACAAERSSGLAWCHR